jgi:hypothetical protein
MVHVLLGYSHWIYLPLWDLGWGIGEMHKGGIGSRCQPTEESEWGAHKDERHILKA